MTSCIRFDGSTRCSDYARITGRAGTIALLAMLAATLLAAPAQAVGGYRLVGAISIATVALGGLLALRLPEHPPDTHTDSDGSTDAGYLAVLRSGLRESVGTATVARAVLVAAAGFTALDEYLPLLSRDKGGGDHGRTVALRPDGPGHGRRQRAGRPVPTGRRAGLTWSLTAAAALLAGGAALLAGGALVPHLAGMAAVSAAFGLFQFAIVHAGTRLQDAITGPARSRVLSVSGFAAEVFAVTLYAGFAPPLALSALFDLSALPLLLTALAIPAGPADAAAGHRSPCMEWRAGISGVEPAEEPR